MKNILDSDWRLLLTFFTSLLIAWYSIPVIVNAARTKNLFDEPNHRTSHKGSVPTLGGIAIFAGFSIPVMLFTHTNDFMIRPYLMAGAMIIFFIGVKDDILHLSPWKKLYGQIMAALIIIVLGDLRFTNMHGFMDFFELNYYLSLFLTLFAIIVIINAFNLIDGIDGLAAGMGIVASVFFGLWFYEVGQMELALMACSLVGTLIAFLRYNFFYSKYKIFMGDTGSLLLGFIVATFTIQFNELNITDNATFLIDAAPAVSFSILFVPLFDTMRVFAFRIYRKGSPFKPDRRHIHHVLLDLGYSHSRATFTLMTVNIFVVEIAWYFQYLGTMKVMAMLLSIGTLLTAIPYYILMKRKRHQQAETAGSIESLNS
ncbi:MAG: undecaprenyl/decaprenyl-phosphate alpha-N-acetylglucosaminyl 1-phosphate transferase [Bacteroidales bacterium]|nr:undecaprenyl/decaprenyl-phosphate alpha-N-acetylglucosaminyl 1-phosphate transferase [Bacteroidales bacterium]